MSTVATNVVYEKGFAKTLREDNWWLYPAIIVFGLGAFLLYGLWSAWQADFYWYSAGLSGFGGYLAPFYSPLHLFMIVYNEYKELFNIFTLD